MGHANQINETNDHPRGRAYGCSVIPYNDLAAINIVGICRNIVQATRNLDTPATQNESDAVRRIGDR